MNLYVFHSLYKQSSPVINYNKFIKWEVDTAEV